MQGYCKSCRKIIDSESYTNSLSRRTTIRARCTLVTSYNRNLLMRYKRRYGCLICNENEPVALDLHHLDPSGKDGDPSNMVSYSTTTLKAEIRKVLFFVLIVIEKFMLDF